MISIYLRVLQLSCERFSVTLGNSFKGEYPFILINLSTRLSGCARRRDCN